MPSDINIHSELTTQRLLKMPATRVPTVEDFTTLLPRVTTSLHFPSPPESTTAILLLFHGLGDNDKSFQSFAQSLNLPGVLAISVRGISPLPPYLLPDHDPSKPTEHFHWGDDLRLDERTGELEEDSGFEKARSVVMGKLVGEVLVGKCGWRLDDILLFGFGQGGAFALGLGSMARLPAEVAGTRVVDVKEGEEGKGKEDAGLGRTFKGIVSIGGALPPSMVPTVSKREKSRTPVLVCAGRESEVVDEDAEERLREEFEKVRVVRWRRRDDGMPRSREEVLPLMEYFAERLQGDGGGWV
jgi:predicted esterase